MAERQQTFAVAGIAGLAALLVMTALIVTGGPFQARKEHRDRIRYDDLAAIKRHVQCMVRVNHSDPPEELTAIPGCGKPPRLQDPFTGDDYHYEVLDQTTLRLCAGFELSPDEWSARYGDQPVTRSPDCLDFKVTLPDPA